VIFATGVGDATAKSWPVARVCGQAKCITVRHPAVDDFFQWWSRPFRDLPVPAPAPYYSIRWDDFSFGDRITTVLLYVPTRHVLSLWFSRVPPYTQGIGPYWRSVPRYEWQPLDRIVRTLTPHYAQREWPRPPPKHRR
jgi:hypothetical protein